MAGKKHGPWTIKERLLKYQNHWVNVFEDQVVCPDGKEGIHTFIDLKTGSVVLPLDGDGHVYLTREFHYGVGRETIEVVAEGVEGKEKPLEVAQRGLKEELGIEAEEWIDLGKVYRFTTYMDNPTGLFLARKLRFSRQRLDSTETISMIKMKLEEAVEKVMNGEINSGMSMILILKAARYLKHERAKPRK